MRRLALAVAMTVAAIDPTGAIGPVRPFPADVEVAKPAPTRADVRAGMAYAANVLRSPMWHRMIDTLNHPADPSLACPYEQLIRHTFPDWPEAVQVAWRESRCQPTAANPTSSARGLMQLLQSLHSHRYYATGACTAADWSDAWCNLAAARHLYDEAGTNPWRLTR
jgi:hypothetical protein